MILLVSKDLLLFVNLSPFMYILEGLRPTSTMIIVSHLKLAQNGCLHARRSCCVRSRAGDAAAVRASVVPGHTHRGTPCNCSSLETRPGLLSENARTRHVCVRRPSCCRECSLFIRERGPEGAGWLASRAGGRLRGLSTAARSAVLTAQQSVLTPGLSWKLPLKTTCLVT